MTRTLITLSLICLLAGAVILVSAQNESPLHPTFTLLDADGANVLETDNPISTMQTCGTCHDTAFIADHSIHVDAGQVGWFGEWNPILYANPTDMTPIEWVETFGWRHVGGGIAEDVGIEMNCFLCHMATPDNASRISMLEAEQFTWANTATLNGTGIVTAEDDNWTYNPDAFNGDGELRAEYVTLGDPTNANCGQCHGLVGENAQIPLEFDPFDTTQWTTQTTGQIFSPQRLQNSGINLANKNEMTRTWDVHAERAVSCTDCHYSLNNPVFYVEPDDSRPDHLEFDPRRMDFGDYLTRPLHQFANGGTNYANDFPVFENGVRDCATCHDAVSTHEWLAYPERHMQVLACESCHIPIVPGAALETINWTSGNAERTYRGLKTDVSPALITGYTPILLPDNDGKLAPHNLVSTWYWAYGKDETPIPLADLQQLYVDDKSSDEIATDLETLGYENPRIVSEVEAYSVHHNVINGEWATRDCDTCHQDDSRVMQPILIAQQTPGGTLPTLIGDNLNGSITTNANGALYFTPDANIERGLYILGHDAVEWVDIAGIGILLATFAGVLLHGGLRLLAAKRTPAPDQAELRDVYMYSIYERQWHWLQTAVIFGLLFTGLIIHKPELFGMLQFRWLVFFHNTFAVILIINAALAAFYHFASGEIQQFLPQPRGFFSHMFAQARYYLWGIFRNEPHPFEKTPDHKMNPIQQVTYLGLLNVLLPLQVITGALMWGAQRYPTLTGFFGGLPLLAPVHSMVSWLMATFIVIHVYMTTTGHTPLTNFKAMVFGWDEVEAHAPVAGD